MLVSILTARSVNAVRDACQQSATLTFCSQSWFVLHVGLNHHRSVNEAAACLSRVSGCREEESRQSLMDYLSFTFTYYKLSGILIGDGANIYNIYNALICGTAGDGE